MPQHITEKKETHFFAIAQFYIRMTFQDLVKPGRAAPQRTDSQERLVGTNVQSCPSWVDSLAQQAMLAFFARGAL